MTGSARWLVPLAAAIWIAGCGGASTTSVSGTITFRGGGVQGARVSIAGQERTTDASGAFEFGAVRLGPQLLEASFAVDEERFVTQRRELVLTKEALTGADVLLPEPVTARATWAAGGTMTVEWTAFTGAGFREYKVYQGGTPGLDETTGRLAFVSTSAEETTCTAWAEAGYEGSMYFRVFVMDERGKLAGSNLARVVVGLSGANLPRPYELRLASARALLGAVAAMTWDGERLWIAYGSPTGGYWDPKPVRLVAYALDGLAELRSFTYTDEFASPAGLAWTGQSLWLAYNAGSEFKTLKSIDPISGAVLAELAPMDPPTDLDFDGSYLLVGSSVSVQRIDPATGRLGTRIVLPEPWDRYSGVAYRPGETWVSTMWGNDLLVLDDAGQVVALVVNPPEILYGGITAGIGRETSLAFIEGRLAIVASSQLYLYDVVPAGTN